METKDMSTSDYSIIPAELLPGESNQPGEIVAPQSLGDPEIAALKTQAARLISELNTASGSQEMAVMDDLSCLGLPEQRHASAELDLLRARMGEMMMRKDSSAQVSHDLSDLRLALNEINPHELGKPGTLHRIFGVLPFFNRLPSPAQVLERIALRYETVSQQVEVIETRLGDGRRLLARDNIELRMLYKQMEAQMLPLVRNIYLGELLIRELDRNLTDHPDSPKCDRQRAVLNDVAMRVQDMRMMEHVFMQFFASIDLTRQNNYRLAQSIERTLSLAANVVTIGLAIQMAMSRQKRVLEATQKTQAFLGEMITSNAAAIKQQTREIGDIYNNPLIALEKVVAAHDQLVEALDMVEQMQNAGIENAQRNIAKLSALSADLHKRALSIPSTPNPPEDDTFPK